MEVSAGRVGDGVVGARRVAEQARAAYTDVVPIMTRLRSGGASLRQIAHHLNEAGHVTRQGQLWNPTQVRRVLGRCGANHRDEKECF